MMGEDEPKCLCHKLRWGKDSDGHAALFLKDLCLGIVESHASYVSGQLTYSAITFLGVAADHFLTEIEACALLESEAKKWFKLAGIEVLFY